MSDKKPADLSGELNKTKQYVGKGNLPVPVDSGSQKSPEELKKEFEDLKKDMEDLKKKILKKYKFTRFLSVLPKQALTIVAEDEQMPVEVEKTNPELLLMCIPEDQFKNIQKIRDEIVSMIRETKKNIWLLVKTEVDLWNYGLDSKYDLLDAVSASLPLHDNGFLGALRVANIHKSLVLRKFDKYVATYVIGGSLVRGTADKDSDVDTFVIIDDTDVKRMPRVELLEKLRGMIYDYIREATALAGVKNILNVQVWLMTDFWQRVKDAEPVAFTFIRDGVPFFDRGTFLPWKLLLKMGKIKPSPEAVDMFMKSGDQTDNLVKRRLMDCMIDIYWGIVTPTQALMMLAGHGPPEPKTIIDQVKKVLVEKEKIMGAKEHKTLEKVVKLYKDYEHGKLKEISGKEIDDLKKESDEFVKKMKDFRQKIEVRMIEHEAERIHEEVFDALKNIFGKKAQTTLIEQFDKELVKKGKMRSRNLEVLKEVSKIKTKVKGKKKMGQAGMQKISAEARELVDALTDYMQRKELVSIQKGIVQINYGNNNKGEVVSTDSGIFLVLETEIKKLSDKKKFVESDKKELENSISNTKDRLKVNISQEVFELIKKEIGEFQLSL